jgi:Ni,Fe-hydrogenase III large subunit/Ni,Fe-hydrogenase III component G
MKLLASLEPIVADLVRRFQIHVERTYVPRSNEVYLHVSVDGVAAISATLHRKCKGRMVGLFAEDAVQESGCFFVYYVHALDAASGFVILRARVSATQPQFTSLSNAFPAVNWQEREIQDLFGMRLLGHPNPRRCALHDDWPKVHPLRRDFDLHTQLPPFEGERHHFRKVEGEGVFQVPVGPVHAGIIEPGHFLFSVAGEPVLYLQLRMFYTHKGTEKLFESMPVGRAVFLAESVSGDTSFGHGTAFCHALERVTGVEVPPRARCIRTVCLELERLYNHIADIGAIATDVAFVIANAHAMRLKERVLRLNEHLTGNRLLRSMVCPGGVRRDWDGEQLAAIDDALRHLEGEFRSLVDLVLSSSSTRDRLEGTGVLTPQVAADLGIVGVAGRASGFAFDLRRDFPHEAYDRVKVNVPVYTEGDVQHRMQVRIDEVTESLRLIREVLSSMPTGEVKVPMPPLPEDEVALGYTEGWRGEIFYWIHTAPDGRLRRCKIKDPSLQNWPALSEAILGNIVPDFPVVNKSFNLSYSGTDR